MSRTGADAEMVIDARQLVGVYRVPVEFQELDPGFLQPSASPAVMLQHAVGLQMDHGRGAKTSSADGTGRLEIDLSRCTFEA
jgi:hypothetical protein